jgi:hypothetical protein
MHEIIPTPRSQDRREFLLGKIVELEGPAAATLLRHATVEELKRCLEWIQDGRPAFKEPR